MNKLSQSPKKQTKLSTRQGFKQYQYTVQRLLSMSYAEFSQETDSFLNSNPFIEYQTYGESCYFEQDDRSSLDDSSFHNAQSDTTSSTPLSTLAGNNSTVRETQSSEFTKSNHAQEPACDEFSILVQAVTSSNETGLALAYEDTPLEHTFTADFAQDGIKNTRHYDRSNSFDNDFIESIAMTVPFRDELMSDIRQVNLSEPLEFMCQCIIYELTDEGFLEGGVKAVQKRYAELAKKTLGKELTLSDWQHALVVLRQFCYPELGAQSVGECLLLQLNSLSIEHPDLREVYEFASPLLRDEHWDPADLFKLKTVDDPETQKLIRMLLQIIPLLRRHPLENFVDEQPTEYIIPDVFVTRKGRHWDITLNMGSLVSFRVFNPYAHSKQDHISPSEMQNLAEAREFVSAAEMRKNLLLNIVKQVVLLQEEWFSSTSQSAPKNMTLTQVAQALEVEISTVSRAIANKYIQCARGMIRLRDLFSTELLVSTPNTDLSAEKANQTQSGDNSLRSDSDDNVSGSVTQSQLSNLSDEQASTNANGAQQTCTLGALIQSLIANEPKAKPFSDQTLVTLLKDKGVEVSRRTVTKYREKENIPSGVIRKRMYAVAAS